MSILDARLDISMQVGDQTYLASIVVGFPVENAAPAYPSHGRSADARRTAELLLENAICDVLPVASYLWTPFLEPTHVATISAKVTFGRVATLPVGA